MSFWVGFNKQAAYATKGIRSGLGIAENKASMLIGARPRSGVAVAAAFKPNKIPAAGNVASAHKNTTPILGHTTSKVPPPMPKQRTNGVGGVTI